MKYTNTSLLESIRNFSLVEIRTGKDRVSFTEIWVVNVGDRLFARSWNLSEKSWFNTFMKEEIGEIKCGEHIYKVKGFVPADIQSLHPRINAAYLAKYDEGENSFYARGIVQPKYYDRTMEFVAIEI